MKGSYLQILLILLVFSAFCNGQARSGLPIDSLKLSKATGNGQLKLIKTSQYGNVHCGLQDQAGNLWFGTTGEGIYRYDGRYFINFTENDGLAGNEVWCIYEDKDSNLWFGTGDGVCCYNSSSSNGSGPGTFFSLRITEPLDNSPSAKNAVWSILQDKTGKFWFGTSNGVYCYDACLPARAGTNGNDSAGQGKSRSITNFLHTNGIVNAGSLQLKHIQSILEDRNGNLWFASWNQEGVCRFDGKTLTNFRPNGDGMVHALLEDKNGNIWFGTRNKGACCYDGKTFRNFSDTGSFGSACIYSIAEDTAGNIWFGTEPSGVWCYNSRASLVTGKDTFTHYTINEGLCNNSVFSVLADHSGKLWFGTRATGLCSYDGKTFRHFAE